MITSRHSPLRMIYYLAKPLQMKSFFYQICECFIVITINSIVYSACKENNLTTIVLSRSFFATVMPSDPGIMMSGIRYQSLFSRSGYLNSSSLPDSYSSTSKPSSKLPLFLSSSLYTTHVLCVIITNYCVHISVAPLHQMM